MPPSRPAAATTIALSILTLAFATCLLAFTVQPGLASFADDSASYLVLAQNWSPWRAASAAVRDVFLHETFYPPMFPLLLAALDAGSDLPRAHAICALLLAGTVPLVYVVGIRWLNSRASAFAATVLFVLMPGVWLNAKGILSEPLFLIVLLSLLLELATRRRIAILALLFVALTLTRAIGCTMAAGFVGWALIASSGTLKRRVTRASAGFAGLAAYAAWTLLRPHPTRDDYADAATGLTSDLLHRLAEQSVALADGWSEALQIYWVSDRWLPHALGLALAAVAMVGWLHRFLRRLPDAWMLAAYFGLLLLWPFPGQTLRFLSPVLPLLLLYAFSARELFARQLGDSTLPAAMLSLCFASLCVPALVFVKIRFDTGRSNGYAQITEWYGSADAKVAQARAQTHLGLFSIMDEVRAQTNPSDRIAWFAPAYVALLADRFAVELPDESLSPEIYREQLQRSEADFALVTTYHPRNTVSELPWRAAIAALNPLGDPVWMARRDDGAAFAALWRLPKP